MIFTFSRFSPHKAPTSAMGLTYSFNVPGGAFDAGGLPCGAEGLVLAGLGFCGGLG